MSTTEEAAGRQNESIGFSSRVLAWEALSSPESHIPHPAFDVLYDTLTRC